jgi:hypothetical protein
LFWQVYAIVDEIAYCSGTGRNPQGQFYYMVFHEMGHSLFDAFNAPRTAR